MTATRKAPPRPRDTRKALRDRISADLPNARPGQPDYSHATDSHLLDVAVTAYYRRHYPRLRQGGALARRQEADDLEHEHGDACDAAPCIPPMTAKDIAALYRVPVGTVHRWASEDRWSRTDTHPRRYSVTDAQASYDKRRITP